ILKEKQGGPAHSRTRWCKSYLNGVCITLTSRNLMLGRHLFPNHSPRTGVDYIGARPVLSGPFSANRWGLSGGCEPTAATILRLLRGGKGSRQIPTFLPLVGIPRANRRCGGRARFARQRGAMIKNPTSHPKATRVPPAKMGAGSSCNRGCGSLPQNISR